MTKETEARLARVREVAERMGLTVSTPPRGKHRYTVRTARASSEVVMSKATLDDIEVWLKACDQYATAAVEVTT